MHFSSLDYGLEDVGIFYIKSYFNAKVSSIFDNLLVIL